MKQVSPRRSSLHQGRFRRHDHGFVKAREKCDRDGTNFRKTIHVRIVQMAKLLLVNRDTRGINEGQLWLSAIL
jgi:hypothetical protein